jgi:chemotaxis signal transduction protein
MTAHDAPIEQALYLTFSVGDEEYGVPVLAVREILEYDTVTRVPRAPAFIRGVINLRGRVVPVVDLAVRFGLAPRPVTPRSCIVIVEVAWEGEPVVIGLVADTVSQVIELLPSEIEPPPTFGASVDVAFLKGLGRVGRRFVLLLDIDRVFTSAEVEEIGEATAAETATEAKASPEHSAKGSLVAGALLLLSLAAGPAVAEEPVVIKDNSFLIEEAYNQERGVVQHISTFSAFSGSGDWAYSFTQEWPLPDERHQLSFTLPVSQIHPSVAARTGIGDAAINYRYEALGIGGGPLAFAPRVSLLAPTGRSRDSLGTGGVGLQVNLPLSATLGEHFVSHWNAGFTHTFSAHDPRGESADTNALLLGQSVVWLAKPRFNVLVETLWLRTGSVAGPGQTSNEDALFVSPGVRFAFDLPGGLQIVPGIAVPLGVGPSRGERSVFFYLSLEHPFRSGGH